MMNRQLTAIMFADMVGYTALMQEDERRAKLLRDRQREVLESRIAEFDGEILQYYGDGALCGFQSAIQAVECSVAIQVDLREEPAVPVRIGIHLGDVVREKTGVYGDGVNLASRIQSLSVPGGVLVSGKVADEVENQPAISTEFLAEVHLKNVKEPRRVFAVTNADLAVPTPKDMKGWGRVAGKGGGRSRKTALAWAIGGLSVIAVAIFGLSRLEEPAPSSQPIPTQERIAILPFEYVGPGGYDWTGDGFAVLLSSALRSGVFLPVDQTSIRSLVDGLKEEGVTGSALLEEIGRGPDVDLVLHGFLSGEPDGGLGVEAYLFDSRTAENVASVSGRGVVDDLTDLALELTRQLLVARGGVDPNLRADLLVTSSNEALQAWSEGDREFRAGNYPRAVARLMDAIEADPEFALAHYRLSQAAIWDWEWDLARDAVEDAWERSSKLTPVNQRLLAAWRDFLRNDPESAEARYQALRDIYPESVEVLAGLGSVLLYYNALRGQPPSEAERLIDAVLQKDPHYGEARYQALDAAARNRDEAEFDRWYGGMNPESVQALAFAAVRAFAWGAEADQRGVIRELASAEEEQLVYAAGRVAASLQDFPAAEELRQLFLSPRRSADYRWAAHALSAALFFAQGQWSAAVRALERTAEGEPEWSLEMRALLSLVDFVEVPEEELRSIRDELESWVPGAFIETSFNDLFGAHAQHHQEFRLFLLGHLSARLGEADVARGYSEELRRFGTSRETQALAYSLSQSVDASIHGTSGDLEESTSALENVEFFPRFEFISASPFFSRVLDRWLWAGWNRDLGKPDEALRWYSTLSDGWGEFLFAGPAHLKQGEIYEELGNREEALFHYERFISLWSEADPELQPLVEGARAAVERLEAGGLPG